MALLCFSYDLCYVRGWHSLSHGCCPKCSKIAICAKTCYKGTEESVDLDGIRQSISALTKAIWLQKNIHSFYFIVYSLNSNYTPILYWSWRLHRQIRCSFPFFKLLIVYWWGDISKETFTTLCDTCHYGSRHSLQWGFRGGGDSFTLLRVRDGRWAACWRMSWSHTHNVTNPRPCIANYLETASCWSVCYGPYVDIYAKQTFEGTEAWD